MQSGVKYLITQWKGQGDVILVEFKRMCRNEHSEYDERTIGTQLVNDQLIDNICSQESCSTHIHQIKRHFS